MAVGLPRAELNRIPGLHHAFFADIFTLFRPLKGKDATQAALRSALCGGGAPRGAANSFTTRRAFPVARHGGQLQRPVARTYPKEDLHHIHLGLGVRPMRRTGWHFAGALDVAAARAAGLGAVCSHGCGPPRGPPALSTWHRFSQSCTTALPHGRGGAGRNCGEAREHSHAKASVVIPGVPKCEGSRGPFEEAGAPPLDSIRALFLARLHPSAATRGGCRAHDPDHGVVAMPPPPIPQAGMRASASQGHRADLLPTPAQRLRSFQRLTSWRAAGSLSGPRRSQRLCRCVWAALRAVGRWRGAGGHEIGGGRGASR